MFTVQAIPDKGLGTVATRAIRQGERVIKEQAALVSGKTKALQSQMPGLQEQFSQLSKERQDRVLQLHDEDPEGSPDRKIIRIFEANAIEAATANSTALYTTIPRINHSCTPNVVWSWVVGEPLAKEVRALRDIKKGEEITANYIDSYEGTFATAEHRQKRLEFWNFVCSCEVCGLPAPSLQQNDKTRLEIMVNHKLVVKMMEGWRVGRAVGAARRKLDLMLSIRDQMISTLPSAQMELWEVARLAQVLNIPTDEDCDILLEEARDLSTKMGARFVHVFHQKVEQVKQECIEAMKAKM